MVSEEEGLAASDLDVTPKNETVTKADRKTSESCDVKKGPGHGQTLGAVDQDPILV